MSHFLDIEKDPQNVISPIVGVFDSKYNLSLAESVKHSESIVPHGTSLSNSCIFFAEQIQETINIYNNMSVDEIASINLYTIESDYYKELNQRLRNIDRKQLIPFFPYLRLLLSGLIKLPSYSGKIWRGVKIDLISKYPKGKKFFLWSFSSCTVSIEVLESDQFCGKNGVRTIFCITTERGRNIKDFSNFSDEGEVILMPGYFVVKCIMSSGNGLSIIDIEELPPPFDIFIGIPPPVVTTPPIIVTTPIIPNQNTPTSVQSPKKQILVSPTTSNEIELLKEKNLDHCVSVLHDYGVQSLEDLQLLDEQDWKVLFTPTPTPTPTPYLPKDVWSEVFAYFNTQTLYN